MMTKAAMRVEIPEDEVGFDHVHASAPHEHIEQAGAICLRQADGREGVEVLLVSSRRNGRWGIPKGHVETGETSREAAQREAFEEAGVKGKATERIVGSFFYRKGGDPLWYRVAVHLLPVAEIARDFPEMDLRKTRWVPIDIASQEVGEIGLGVIFHGLI